MIQNMFKRYYHILHHFVILNIWIYSAPYLLIPYWLIFKWSSGHVLKLARPPISFRQLIFQQPHEEDGLNWFFLLQDHPHHRVDILILNSNTLPHFEHLNRASCLTHKSHTVICVWFCSIRAKYSCFFSVRSLSHCQVFSPFQTTSPTSELVQPPPISVLFRSFTRNSFCWWSLRQCIVKSLATAGME